MYNKQDPYSQQQQQPTPVTGVAVPGFVDYSNMNTFHANNNNNNVNNFPVPPPPPPSQQQQMGWGQFTSTATTTITTCNMSSEQLEQHLRESNHGSNTNIFNCYFIPAQMPPRCAACSRLIAEHLSSSHHGSSSSPMAFAGAPQIPGYNTLVPPQNGAVSEDDMPSVTTDGNKDIYVNSGLFVFKIVGSLLLTIGIVLFIVFGTKFDPDSFADGTVFIAPSVLTFIGCVFTLLSKKVTIIFDKDTRRAAYHSSRFPWICFNSSETINFSDIYSVSVEDSNVMVNRVPQSNLKLRFRGGGNSTEIDLGMMSCYTAATKAAGWKVYLARIGCPITN